MGEDSKIQWTSHTFNMWRGCTKKVDNGVTHPGCLNCYAEAGSKRNPAVLGVWGEDGTRPEGTDTYWRQPFKWNKDAWFAGERRRVFCASLADVFEDRRDLDAARIKLVDTIRATPNLRIRLRDPKGGDPQEWPEDLRVREMPESR